jgi:hypothetical protein
MTSELRFESVVTPAHIESVSPEYRLEPEARTYPFAYSSEERADLARGMERRYPSEDVRNGQVVFWPRPERWTRCPCCDP